MAFAQSGRILNDDDTPYYIVSPFDGNDLRDIQYAQLNDVLYLAHPDYPVHKLTRYDHNDWSIEEVTFEGGPFLAENTDTGITITPSGAGDAEGYDYYKTGDDAGYPVRGAFWLAQTFTASDNYTLSSIRLKLYRINLPGTATISLKATTAGKPSGADLATATFDGNTLPINEGGTWLEYEFDSAAALTSGTVYALVLRAPSGSLINTVRWRADVSSPAYTGGSLCDSGDSGSTWNIRTEYDALFDTGVEGVATTSNIITLEASADIFDPNHVGAIWRLTHTVESETVEGAFTSNVIPPSSGVDDQVSASLTVSRNQDFIITTDGYWYGLMYVQKSYDDGTTWINVHTHRNASGLLNMEFRGTETVDDALYRLELDDHVGYYAHRDEIYYSFKYSMVAVSYQRQGIVEIDSVTDANTATATVIYPLGGTDATYIWAEGAWSGYRGYPRAVCFYQNRLCLASTSYQPNMLWCSQSSDFENMTLGAGLDNEAIAREIGSAGQNPIMWIKDKRGLIAATTGAIIRIGTPGSKYIFTPSTITSERSVETGSCSIQPGLTVSSIVYVDRNRRKVRDLKYDVASDDMVSPDLTLFSDDISDPNILEMAWQKRPDERGWFIRGDGRMVTLSYNPSEGVEAWTEVVTDGNYVSVCVIPGVDEDEVWTAVVRDSNDYVMIEKFHNQDWTDDVWFVDSGLEYLGVAATTLTGLGHLEGELVQVYSDANGYIGDYTVSSGSITLATSETQAIAGLPYTATIKTFPIEVSTQLGPSVGVLKNVRLITLALYESEGGRYAFPPYETKYDIKYPAYSTDFYTGLARQTTNTGYQMEAYLIIDQNEPLPLGLTGIAINKYELSNDN
jgi:hypothetical protein